MTTKDFNAIVNQQLLTAKDLLTSKGHEYAGAAEDRLSAFKKAAALQGTDQKAALFGMLAKHLVSLSDMCTSGQKYNADRWTEKITDAINYLILLRAVVTEEDTPHEIAERPITLFNWHDLWLNEPDDNG